MALDAYSPCPCGSGKKFKWCCQPIHAQIEKAFRQENEGQHEVALRLLDEVIAEHPTNPEPLGRKAQVLFQNDRVEDAEQVLEKAFAINPNYAFGHLLRGMFRQQEGELEGALSLFRKAADLYDPEARDILGQVYTWIAECEFRLNRPVASHAAVKLAIHCDPANTDLRKATEEMYGEGSVLPASARKDYQFQSPAASLDPQRRAGWDRILQGELAKLTDAARV
ncbi:MAG: tetratricopeptide repeat protein, partial [Gemmataceae bacterium]